MGKIACTCICVYSINEDNKSIEEIINELEENPVSYDPYKCMCNCSECSR